MTSSYANPRTWSSEITDVKLRDVFQVVSADCDKNPNLHAGDFYIAKYEGDIKDYPANGRDDDNWYFIAETWSGVTNIKLSTDNGQTASIFANGLQMTRVYVHMGPTDQGGKTMTVDPVTRLNAITLVNYNTGEALKKIDTPTPEHPTTESGWLFCTTPNDFVTRDEEGHADDDNNTLTLYVLCNDKDRNSSMSIGVSIQPSSGLPVLDTANGSTYHSQVTVTAKATPAINRLTRDDFVMTAVNMQHDGQLDDEANNFMITPQTAGNLWRQNNFYLQFSTASGRKLVKMIINHHETPLYGDESLFAEYVKDGYRTRAYLWSMNNDKETAVNVLDGLTETIITNDREGAICVTYVTSVSAVDNYYKGANTSSVSATIYDTEGNSFDFCPNHYLPESYSDVLDITQHYTQSNMIDKVFLLNTTTSKSHQSSEITSGHAYIYNEFYSKFVMAGNNTQDFTYIGKYQSNDAYYQYSLRSENKYSTFYLYSSGASDYMGIAPKSGVPMSYRVCRNVQNDIIKMEINVVPVWTLNAFYFRCLNADVNSWVRAIPDVDSWGSQSLERTDNMNNIINNSDHTTSDRLWKFKYSRF